ncbi:MAG TPA: Glu/Leu/Phe/Val dehydrogenase [Candidatus Limnocylindria bacterium]|nr:Glu/Leu/Phe/Val dehydrogenase [Candidatus Limnocylindria bacterium]
MVSSKPPVRSLWTVAQQKLDEAAERLRLDEGMHKVLRVPKRELEVHFPVRFDDGHVEAFTGYRVHHNLNRGPATGGVRFTQDLTLDLVRANAMWNTWKAALVQIPYGGAFGGVVVNPRTLSEHEREGLTRRYATEIKLLIGPERDIPSPDVNTGSQTMAWMMDTYSMHLGYTVAAVVAGKPLEVGGTAGRRAATSRGALRATLAAARKQRMQLDGARVAIQGFGRVGSTLAEMLAEVGMQIVAIADDHHAVRNPRGIDVRAAVEHMRAHDAIRGLPDAEPMDRASLFETECDVLVSAGLQDQIDGPVAERVRASMVVEAANGPTTLEGEQVLAERGVPVLPDILCTAGGMVLSYFEWVQDMQSFFWTDDEISANLDRIMDDATAGIFAMAEEHKVDLRSAAMMVAVHRVAEATTLRGLYP